jgi:hypothetical protein
MGVSRGASTVAALARCVIVRWNVRDHDRCSLGWQLAHAADPTYPPSATAVGAPTMSGAARGLPAASAITASAIATASASFARRVAADRKSTTRAPAPRSMAHQKASRGTSTRVRGRGLQNPVKSATSPQIP